MMECYSDWRTPPSRIFWGLKFFRGLQLSVSKLYTSFIPKTTAKRQYVNDVGQKHLGLTDGKEKEKICNAASDSSDKGIFREFIAPIPNSMGPNDQDGRRLAVSKHTYHTCLKMNVSPLRSFNSRENFR